MTKKKIIIPLIIILIIIGAGFGIYQWQKYKWVGRDEYEIYKVVFQEISLETETIVIQRPTSIRKKLDEETLAYIEKDHDLKLDSSIVDDFSKKNEQSYQLKDKFNLSQEVVFVSTEEFNEIMVSTQKGWDEFYKKYENSGGIIEISRVGFNRQRSQAIFHFGVHRDIRSGIGHFILLNKENGKWVIKEWIKLWIS